ncbi:MAG: formate/nitrite transporter family protein [Peptostreptococcaceae bacterium]
MDKKFLTPGEIAKATINAGVKKAGLPTKTCIYLGMLAGFFIGLGGLANIIVSQTLGGIDIGLAKFSGAMVFPVGLMLVVICGAELFTGNNLMTLAVMDKKITMGKMFRNWGLVWCANFIGSLVFVALVYYSNTLGGDAAAKAIAIAESKAALPVMDMFLRAILCNMVVVLAVWFATAAQDIVSKIFACWFPIMLFVLCGFEHSIANMFFIPMGMVLGGNIAMAGFITNIVVVTLGNVVGGAIVIPYLYYNCYLKDDSSKSVATTK